MYEKNIEKSNKRFEDFQKSRIAKEIETAFPDAQLVEVNEREENE